MLPNGHKWLRFYPGIFAMDQGQNTYERPKAIFRKHGGVLRTNEAINAGIHPRTLYAMRDASVVEKLTRGLYRLADMPRLEIPILSPWPSRCPRVSFACFQPCPITRLRPRFRMRYILLCQEIHGPPALTTLRCVFLGLAGRRSLQG